MSDIAIQVERLSKRYRIGVKESRPETFTGALTGWLKSPMQNLRKLHGLSHFSDNGHEADDTIWALKDVSFEVKQGEVVGIIGRNGAGKSTLLKILSRITEPSSGRAVINGRVASLLEVGTGFHPDLTGRENIYLNGAVLGMSKQEIEYKFDEIIDFSGVEKFIDTPVKFFSSGMKVRLAFAVAAHLEPEVLIVDEVLAVGDVEFQKRCIARMQKVSQLEGRTVLFVSHNLGAINSLCQTGLLLNQGKLVALGPVRSITDQYGRLVQQTTDLSQINFEGELDAHIKFRAIKLNNVNVFYEEVLVSPSEKLQIKLQYDVTKQCNFRLMISIYKDGVRLFSIFDINEPKFIELGMYSSSFTIPPFLLRPGVYSVAVGGYDGHQHGDYIWAEDVFSFSVLQEWSDLYEERMYGVVNLSIPSERVRISNGHHKAYPFYSQELTVTP